MSVSAKDKIDVSLISKPSDLFGKELLPECKFESEYGKLKFNPILVPDFSNNKIEFENLTKHLEEIKTFIKEEDLLKKSEIIESILEPVLINFGHLMIVPDFKKYFLFINILSASVQFS